MRTYFSRLPGDILRCPMCADTLSKADVAPSESVRANLAEQSLIPWHEFSQVFTCRTCQWWCIREYWVLGELSGNGDRDYVIMGIAKKWNLLNKTLPLDILHTYFEPSMGLCRIHHGGCRGSQERYSGLPPQ